MLRLAVCSSPSIASEDPSVRVSRTVCTVGSSSSSSSSSSSTNSRVNAMTTASSTTISVENGGSEDVPVEKPVRLERARILEASACAAAVMSSMMLYSVLQERIMTRPYEPLKKLKDGLVAEAFFKDSLFLVLANRLTAALVAVANILIRGRYADFKSKAPMLDYITISLSNVIATSCQYEALKWLTFPTLTIGKCAKMLPVMLILNLRKKRRYSLDDFGVAVMVLAGCAIMISSGNVAAKRLSGAEEDSAFGFILLLLYLLFDAITSTYQQRLFERYDMSVSNQMIFINISSSFISVIGLATSGGLLNSVEFLRAYPRIVPDIATLSISAVAGQFAISYTIQSFGALLYAGIMTTRQFFSVLASDIIFKHGLTATQWTGACMVFSALFYKLWRKAVRGAD